MLAVQAPSPARKHPRCLRLATVDEILEETVRGGPGESGTCRTNSYMHPLPLFLDAIKWDLYRTLEPSLEPLEPSLEPLNLPWNLWNLLWNLWNLLWNPLEIDLALRQSPSNLLRDLVRNFDEFDLALRHGFSKTFSKTFPGTFLKLTSLSAKATQTFSGTVPGTFSRTLLNLT